ncbi:CBS domain-containing protein [Paracrocinitomix mangrovi]|uniref:CBS domain-containing protein n=1 Tax=Paracrocinitomix mangrovi TaxID=2862509 RepID=UPI001C8F0E8C|nr:CBS domain-containing protein [Paracrocinitomix mangrovi]UKN02212.1 CBS domain-containing protein [Paracrocinitomix mangrovi]
MKISASIYSDKQQALSQTIQDLNESHVDMIHVDCKDDLNVFTDIDQIQQSSHIPIDLHIITTDAKRFIPALQSFDIEYVTFQYEDLVDKNLDIPKEFSGQLGLAITTETPIDVFSQYAQDFDFILFMCTIPGESGGVFDKRNFRRIRAFQSKYPHKKVHVDGGVNAEVSFILRNMGVYASVSGSYLFNSTNINSALLNLKLNEIESHFQVRDFMKDLDESPVIFESDLNLQSLLRTMNEGKLGFVMILNQSEEFVGIIGNADLRRGLLTSINDLNNINVSKMINRNPLSVKGTYTVHQLLRFIKKESMPIVYLPVIDDHNKAIGTINFMNLIKGEL